MKRSPLRKPKPRKRPDELERMAAFKAAAGESSRCLACPRDDAPPTTWGPWHAHQVVTQQHVRQADGDPWDPRNAMRLCSPCHDAHHSRQRPIPLNAVPLAAWEFAYELLGQNGADAYMARYYGPHRWFGY